MDFSMRGLSAKQVVLSREKNGNNYLQKERQKGFFGKFYENIKDPIIKVLLVAIAIEIVCTWGRVNWIEIGGIALAVLVASLVSTVSECGSERAFLKIQEEADQATVRVFRDGVLCRVCVNDIVVGDVLLLSSGERVPADGTVMQGTFRIDQSALNGENKEVSKSAGKKVSGWDLHQTTQVFRGSVIVDGEGIVCVGRVGGQTFYGMVAKDVQSETRQSPLKLRLSALAQQISKIGYWLAGIVGAVYLFSGIVIFNGYSWTKICAMFRDVPAILHLLSQTLTYMITVIVVAVPEGLPMMITVVLSSNMKRMLQDGVLVKKPVGIETAGSLNILFTDKTGTLTCGKMALDRIITAQGTYRTPTSVDSLGFIGEALTLCAAYNTDCRWEKKTLLGGNATDRAIASFFGSKEARSVSVLHKIPFSSDRKYSAVCLDNACAVWYIKGAPEWIFSQSVGCLQADGSVSQDMTFMQQAYKEAAASGERVIAIATAEGEKAKTFVLVGLFIFAGVFNCFNARTERLRLLADIRKNRAFVIIMLFISVIQLLMMYFGGKIFRTVPLRAYELGVCVALAFSVVPFDLFCKIFRHTEK